MIQRKDSRFVLLGC